MFELRKTMLSTTGHRPRELERLLDTAEVRVRQGAEEQVKVLRAVLSRHYGHVSSRPFSHPSPSSNLHHPPSTIHPPPCRSKPAPGVRTLIIQHCRTCHALGLFALGLFLTHLMYACCARRGSVSSDMPMMRQAVAHLEEQRQGKVRAGGTLHPSNVCEQASKILGHAQAISTSAAAAYSGSAAMSWHAALPYAQVHAPVAAGARRASAANTRVPSDPAEEPLFGGTPTMSQRRQPDTALPLPSALRATPARDVDMGAAAVEAPSAAKEHSKFAAMTPHRLVARHTSMQTGMLQGQPSPYVAPWWRGVAQGEASTPGASWSTPAQKSMATARTPMGALLSSSDHVCWCGGVACAICWCLQFAGVLALSLFVCSFGVR